jgi:hypothetical protein
MPVSFGLLRVRVAFAAAALMMVGAPAAHARYEITVAQVGSNLVLTGSGSVDVTGYTSLLNENGTFLGQVAPVPPLLGVGSSTGATAYFFSPGNFMGSIPFASLNYSPTNANHYTGSIFKVENYDDALILPQGYVSGTDLGTSTSTYDNANYAFLDLIPGVYTWTLPNDSVTLTIPAAVPEPPGLALLGLPAALLLLTRGGKAARVRKPQ